MQLENELMLAIQIRKPNEFIEKNKIKNENELFSVSKL